VVAAVCFGAEVCVFKAVGPAGVISLPTRVELVELVGCVGFGAEKRGEELFGVLIIHGEDRVDWEWSEGNVDDSQVGG